MTSEEGCGIINNSWKAAFITEAILKGKKGFEPLDPFFTVDLYSTMMIKLMKKFNQTKTTPVSLLGDSRTKVTTMMIMIGSSKGRK